MVRSPSNVVPPYGDLPEILLDGTRLRWKPDELADVVATRKVAAGEHLLLLDWQCRSHDTDIALALSGVAEMSAHSPLAGEQGNLGDCRSTGRTASGQQACQDGSGDAGPAGASWTPVSELDTPVADVYMDITASTGAVATHDQAAWPLHVPSTRWGQAQQYLVDFGREVIGWIELDATAQAGTQIDFLGFEGIQEGRWQISQLMNNTLRYTCNAGRQTYTSLLRRRFPLSHRFGTWRRFGQ